MEIIRTIAIIGFMVFLIINAIIGFFIEEKVWNNGICKKTINLGYVLIRILKEDEAIRQEIEYVG